MDKIIKGKTKKGIAFFLVIILLYASISYGIEGLISYAADETTDGTITLDFNVGNINKGNITEENTANYSETWNLNLTAGTNLPTSVTMTNPAETIFYRTVTAADGTENLEALADVASTYSSTILNKSELTTILVNSGDGAEGKIKILNADTNAVLKEITESNVSSQEDFITIEYSSSPKRLSIVLENINTESTTSLSISHTKTATGIASEYVQNNIISKIESKLNFVAGSTNETYTVDSYIVRTTKVTLSMDNNNTTSTKEIDNRNVLFTSGDNAIKLNAEIHTENEEYELINDLTIILAIPSYVTKVAELGTSDITINNNKGFSITDMEDLTDEVITSLNTTWGTALGASKVISFTVNGTQSAWTTSSTNINLDINLNLTVGDTIPSTIKPIKLYYQNTGTTQYEDEETGETNISCGVVTQEVSLQKGATVTLTQTLESSGEADTTQSSGEDNSTEGNTIESENTIDGGSISTEEEISLAVGENLSYILAIDFAKQADLINGTITIEDILPEGIEPKKDDDGNYEIYNLDVSKEVTYTDKLPSVDPNTGEVITDPDTGETVMVEVERTEIEYEKITAGVAYDSTTRKLTVPLSIDKELPIIEFKNTTINNAGEEEEITSYSIGTITKNIKIIVTASTAGKTVENKVSVIANDSTYESNALSITTTEGQANEEDGKTTENSSVVDNTSNALGITVSMDKTESTWEKDYNLTDLNSIRLSTIKSSSNIFCRQRGGRQGNLSAVDYNRDGAYSAENNSLAYILSYPWSYSDNNGALTNQYIQRAVWRSSIKYDGTFTGSSGLYTRSLDYEDYIGSYVEKTITGDNAILDDNGYVGPFQITYSTSDYFGGIDSIVLYGGETKETADTVISKTADGKTVWSLVNADKSSTITTPSNKTDFYVRIHDMDYFTNQGYFFLNLKIKFNEDIDTHASYYKLWGSGKYTYNYTVWCSSCQNIRNSVGSGGSTYVKYGGNYYKLYSTGKWISSNNKERYMV